MTHSTTTVLSKNIGASVAKYISLLYPRLGDAKRTASEDFAKLSCRKITTICLRRGNNVFCASLAYISEIINRLEFNCGLSCRKPNLYYLYYYCQYWCGMNVCVFFKLPIGSQPYPVMNEVANQVRRYVVYWTGKYLKNIYKASSRA